MGLPRVIGMDVLDLNWENSDVAIVIVLFQPEQADLDHLVELGSSTGSVVAVGNALPSDQACALRDAAGVKLIDNRVNAGLAKALNQGLEQAFANGASYVLMLDQDSRLSDDFLPALVADARRLENVGCRLACIGPILRDRKSPTAKVSAGATDEVRTIATSGSLMTARAWADVGPMREDLFIDGIDHEWCFRAASRGFRIELARNVELQHDMGEKAVILFGRYRPLHRSPIRHYFIVRNTLWLLRCSYIPFSWRAKEFLKTPYRIASYLIVSSNRKRTARNIFGAIFDGLSLEKKNNPI